MRTNINDPLLATELAWNPRVRCPGGRGALVGTLFGVPVTGMDRGRGVAYQVRTVLGEVRTVWWDGMMWGAEGPGLFDVDTGVQVQVNPIAVASFDRLAAVS